MQHVIPGEDLAITNVTDDYGVLVLAGPKSRDVLSGLSDTDLTNEGGFTWLRAKQIKVAGIPVRALRISYVGELGWELHCKMDALSILHGRGGRCRPNGQRACL